MGSRFAELRWEMWMSDREFDRDHPGMNRTLLLALVVAALCHPPESVARTATRAERVACEAKIQPKIDALDSKLRDGYTASEGEKLKERRRKLVAQRDACRKAT